MTAIGHQIETERLILRLPRRDDFDRYAELHADEAATRFIGGVLPSNPRTMTHHGLAFCRSGFSRELFRCATRYRLESSRLKPLLQGTKPLLHEAALVAARTSEPM